jgi:hypothetical protein
MRTSPLAGLLSRADGLTGTRDRGVGAGGRNPSTNAAGMKRRRKGRRKVLGAPPSPGEWETTLFTILPRAASRDISKEHNQSRVLIWSLNSLNL